MQYEYYYSKLSQKERQVYRKINESLKLHSAFVEIHKLEDNQLLRVIRALEYDHPELYFWDTRKVVTKTNSNKMALKLAYYWSTEEIEKNAPKIENGIRAILSKADKHYDSQYDMFLGIYGCMARNIKYDFEGMNSDEKKDMAYAHTILGVFAKKKAVCDGISKAFKLVLERAGLDCIVIEGAKASTNGKICAHAWNIVWIEDKPCHVDLTWAVEASKPNTINHDYVGLTDNQIHKDHEIKSILDIPKCETNELDYYVRNKAVINSVEELQKYLQVHAHKKPFEINVRLDFNCDIKAMAKKASDYVIKHFVIAGDCVDIKVDSQYREGQNILIMTGK